MSAQVLIFYDPSFPAAGNGSLSRELLEKAGTVVEAAGLAEALRVMDGGCFVNVHAPYFPKEAWPDILAFLRRGGGLISIGGAPFRRPVRLEEGRPVAEAEQTAYHRQLNIHEMLPVDRAPVRRLQASADVPLFEGKEDWFEISDTWNLVPHVTKASDLPHEMGSAGPMDTRIAAVLKGISAEGREVAAPAVLWEHTKGPFAGGRWLLINQPVTDAFWNHGGAGALRDWAAFCAGGVTEIWLKPNYAAYEPGERAVLTLQAQWLGRGEEPAGPGSGRAWTFDLALYREDEAHPLWSDRVTMHVDRQLRFARIPVPVELAPGFYRIACTAQSANGELRRLRQGFWGYDRELLARGTPVRAGRDYFEQDGRPLPVVGMTYMTSDVARKYLFLPNAAVWDRDMEQMSKAGINWIRTGVWTAYRNIMQVDGHASEEVLRAIDAFLMTAKKHGLHVTFTFFSFTPETWEGKNPYLDPRSVEAQKRYIRSIVSRHKRTTNVDWDLINEPSMFDPARIFAGGPRSCRDPFERAAFAEWLKERHGTVERLQERWNMTPEELPSFEAAEIPEPDEINFDVQDMHQGKKGTRWLDYVLFSMDMFNRWAQEMVAAIKDECPDHLVTAGQDEALGAQRPSPFFYGKAVDYTTVHSWWLNDQLVWDGIFAKTLHKPNLVQETGIMYVETPEGKAKRSEAELRNMLERKYAYAFATGGAGAIHWIWNTNYYMDNANESHIGALRADGTEKPEADVSYDFGRFIGEIRDLFRDRELEDVVAVFPYSNDFSNRKFAFEATARLTRVLAYHLKVPFRAVGEYQLDELGEGRPRLILLPSPHNMDDAALTKLLEHVRLNGGVLLATGPLSIDAYWRKTDRVRDLLGPTELRNVVREERVDIGGAPVFLSYGQRKIAEVMKEVRLAGDGAADRDAAGADRVAELPLGKGRLIWCPLPAEVNDRTEAVERLYAYALNVSGYQGQLEWIRGGDLPGVYGRKLNFRDGALFVFVSEYACDTAIEVKDRKTGCTYAFALPRERSVLFAADAKGELLAVYRPDEVKIHVSR